MDQYTALRAKQQTAIKKLKQELNILNKNLKSIKIIKILLRNIQWLVILLLKVVN